jgi:hypothetical protein
VAKYRAGKALTTCELSDVYASDILCDAPRSARDRVDELRDHADLHSSARTRTSARPAEAVVLDVLTGAILTQNSELS